MGKLLICTMQQSLKGR